MIKKIRGAVAMGYCYNENSHKEMDSTLTEAISQEVLKLFKIYFKKPCRNCDNGYCSKDYCQQCRKDEMALRKQIIGV